MKQIVEMSITDIKPYENNPRFNSEAVEVVAKSIKEFGFQNPIIVDSDNVIIAGHTRHKASQLLGLKVVPVIVANDLSPEQVKAFRIMDNKSGEFAEWDYVKLLEDIEDLQNSNYDIDLTGFSAEELDEFLPQFLEEEEAKEEEEKAEIEFDFPVTSENNYVVLYIDNSIDWEKALDIFGLKSNTIKDEGVNYVRKGVGRGVEGAKYLRVLEKAKERGEI